MINADFLFREVRRFTEHTPTLGLIEGAKESMGKRFSCMFAIAATLLAVLPQLYVKTACAISFQAKNEVVFLLDASNSMNTNDKDRLAIDSIAQLIYSLPSNYDVGFVAYNTGVVSSVGMVDCHNRESVMKSADAVQYSGFTNAGAGITQALSLMRMEKAEKKTIVILSDGEITMQNDAKTAESSARFLSEASEAKKEGVKIHVIGLGDDMKDRANTIFSVSKITGGQNYHAPKARDIQKAVDSILLDQLNIRKTTAAIVNAGGGTENLTVKIPSAHAGKVRILFTSDGPLKDLKADFSAGSGKQFNGIHYSLIEMDRPAVNSVHVSFQGKQGSQVKVDVISEYDLMVKAAVKYRDMVPATSSEKKYKRAAEINFTFYDAQNPNVQLLFDRYFENAQIPILINGKSNSAVLKKGVLEYSQQVAKNETLKANFDFSSLTVNILPTKPVTVELKGPPPLPPDYRPFYVGGAVLLFMGVIAVFLVVRWKRRPIPIPEPLPPAPSKYSYTGKLNLYITRTPSGYDVPPLTYNLFRLSSNRVLSLQEILNECNVEEHFEGAGKIFFQSGANHSLVITNSSDCTIMRNRAILMKNRSYQLAMESKVDITFEDEVSELTFQYKNSKPNEISF